MHFLGPLRVSQLAKVLSISRADIDANRKPPSAMVSRRSDPYFAADVQARLELARLLGAIGEKWWSISGFNASNWLVEITAADLLFLNGFVRRGKWQVFQSQACPVFDRL